MVNGGVTHMYSIASEDSLISGEDYKKFLDEMNLPYQEENLCQIVN